MEDESGIVVTGDGSTTLFSRQTGDHYHSLKGAETESSYVFIKQGLDFVRKYFETVRILEVGMGTGLNLLLTAERKQHNREEVIEYTALEPFPIEQSLVKKLKYSVLERNEILEIFNVIHESPWDMNIDLSSNFALEKKKCFLMDYKPDKAFNLVYYDAFGPSYQPEMWTAETMLKLHGMMEERGVLVTYCAQGEFRRNLKAAGFEVEKLPGPPGKREMVRAIKSR